MNIFIVFYNNKTDGSVFYNIKDICQFIVKYNIYEKTDYIIDKINRNNYYSNNEFTIYKRICGANQKISKNDKVIYFDNNYNLHIKYTLLCVKQYKVDILSYGCFCRIKSFSFYSDYNNI